MLEILLTAGAAVTAVTAIGVFLVKIYKFFKKLHTTFHEFSTNVGTLLEHDKSQYLAILRLTIVSTDMPLSERLLAGQKYIDCGGNGDIKKLYNELLEQCNNTSNNE